MSVPHVVRIGHAVFYVTDLAASRHFYVDLLGLNVLHESDRALYLRGMEDREWTLKLELAREPGVKQLGYKVGSDAALDEIVEIAEEQGLPYRWETEQDRPRLLRLQDPFGFPLAFYFQSVKHPWLLQRFDLHRGPGIQRIDHNNVLSPEVKSLTDWYRQNLDFRLTEYSEDDEGRIWASWMQRKGHAHDLATTNGSGPRLHHLAYWMPDGSRISQTCDIFAGAFEADHIERGPGRHGITNAFFLYLRDPDGHRIELFTSDYLAVDPDFEPIRWHINDSRRQQLWGGTAPKSWFLEGSVVEAFEGGWVKVEESQLQGLPVYVR
ncbi:MAG TPA: 3,4-dihydroxyphenylacetate 2,3-dioxygenase [Bryobacteraceae bacterium]|nr:3,4-dihydroxyphenylacetate 2,3-dioxygenase [Bryobacteraceae bacterium]HUO32141.1 3,4-dihydroxyphenylacetate 2,3-dioxygenase [Bryobacteraceae bacterium]